MSVFQGSERLFQNKFGWVMNPWLDFICFYIPLLTAFFLKLDNIMEIFVLKVTFEIGHLFVTVLPLYLFSKAGNVDMKPLIRNPLLVLLAVQVVCFFHFNLFTYIFGYYAMYHICAQFYGWLARIQRNTNTPINKFDMIFERIFLVVMLLSSALFWHTTYSTMPKGWFYEENLIIKVPGFVWDFVNNIFLILAAVWIARTTYNFLKYNILPIGKISLIASVWLMFYFSLVLNFDGKYGTNFFWYVISLNHGLSYILFVFTNSFKSSLKEKTVPFFILYMGCVFIVGVVWSLFFKFSLGLDARFAATLLWGPLILHYIVDSIIWRKSFKKYQLTTA